METRESIPASGVRGSIVVATDFSAAADLAVERAAVLARSLDAGLFLLHVFNDGVWRTMMNVFDIGSWRGPEPALLARDQLSRQAAELAARTRLDVRAECLTGSAAEQIAAFAASNGARLLVVGQHGENAIDELVLGSTALKLLSRSCVPVLLARPGDGGQYARVLVATDFSDCAHRLAQKVPALFPLARRVLMNAYVVPYEGRLRLAGATDAEIEEYRSRERERAELAMTDFAAGLDTGVVGQYERRVVHGFPAGAILEHAAQMHADLIAIGRHGGGVAEERLLGSVTQNVLYNSRCDLLLMP